MSFLFTYWSVNPPGRTCIKAAFGLHFKRATIDFLGWLQRLKAGGALDQIDQVKKDI